MHDISNNKNTTTSIEKNMKNIDLERRMKKAISTCLDLVSTEH